MSSRRLFLSHATTDRELVEAFENLLSKVTGTTSSDIFVSSLEGQGVPKGGNFVDDIRQEVTDADAVIALISPAYLDSPFCMAELGAAWALGTKRFPVVVPPATFADVDATQLGLTAIALSDSDQLDQMMADLNDAIGTKPPKSGIRRRALANFERSWPELATKIGSPQRIAKSIYQETLERVEELEKELADADTEIRQNEEMIERLREAKDRTEVVEIDHEFAKQDLAEEFKRLINNVTELSEDLGGKAVLLYAIMDHYGRAGVIDWENRGDEFERAIQHSVLDPDSNELAWGAPDLRKLAQRLNALEEFLGENDDAAFLTEDDKRGPEDRRFWSGRS